MSHMAISESLTGEVPPHYGPPAEKLTGSP